MQYLSCKDKQDDDSCGKCSNCHKLSKYIHPDVHFSFPIVGPPAHVTCRDHISTWQTFLLEQPFGSLSDWGQFLEMGNKQPLINVHEAGSIRKYLSLKPLESPYRIVIIWHAEKLNNQAANKLLKSIEEPPENTFFFLQTSSMEHMLGTILSRTQLRNVKPPQLEELKGFYSNKNASEIESYWELSNYNLSKFNDLINQRQSASGVEAEFIQWMRRCFKADVAYLIAWSEKIAREFNREEQKSFLAFCLALFRESIARNVGALQGASLVQSADFDINKFAPFVHQSNVITLYEEFNEAHYLIERNANAKIVFFELSLKLTKLLRVKAD